MAENRVAKILRKLNIKYKSEISFYDCKSEYGNYLIFDFIIPTKNIVIEYDGEKYHRSKQIKQRDKIKNDFLKDNGYCLLRLNKSHWTDLEQVIKKFIKGAIAPKIKKKGYEYCPDNQKMSIKNPRRGSHQYFRSIKVTIDDLTR